MSKNSKEYYTFSLHPHEGLPVYAEVLGALHKTSFSQPWSVESFEELLSSPCVFGHVLMKSAPVASDTIVDEGGEEPIGFYLGRICVDEAELLTICLIPSARGQGLAKRLMSKFLDKSCEVGAKSLFLEVSVNNIAAKSLYLSYDFRNVGMRRNYYMEQTSNGFTRVDAEIMRYDIK